MDRSADGKAADGPGPHDDRTTRSIPSHIGIIMDGNGRWAQQRNQARVSGHREGLKAAKRIVRAAAEIGIGYLTMYAFSTENWKRTVEEVGFLMRLIGQNLRKEYDFYRTNNVRLVHSGNLDGLPANVRKELDAVTRDTANFDGVVVNLAINYGGRDEIVRSVNRWLDQRGGINGEDGITEQIVGEYLDRPEMPDPDLIIRTGGERRLSNFLLWESAYAEYYFSPKLWPDWQRDDLIEAVNDFALRERKYGGIK